MASKTVGFAVASEDRTRLDRLVRKFGGGNRSAFLRVAIEHMEAVDRAERLSRLQAYGAQRSSARGLNLADVEEIVHRVLSRSRRR